MTTKITVFTKTNENGDSPYKTHTVKVNDVDVYTPFYHLPDAKAAAFNEACKASLDGPVRVEQIEI